ncbi:uncharacterized protein PHALS_05978 [Plasmopara halstedii]|uniref:Uncharacterized protein n=1 Tax=Plasmopara halstedii TaxID=4781 RepID=A0A0P1AAT2_PLAHL|nr:uncharacterized protein PHALS_05978 [Plasmopara halstedii]CEG37932.1 hypothetical protein PHALS_05978 [Plasmopara halstedii]|eukprot:XP_024574301.1 hypothetical protein PHALS_05978 [Plasmopara halstedii]
MAINWHSRAAKLFPELIRDLKTFTYNLESTVSARFYGMPKIHKSPMGLRPIVSSMNSPFHEFSRCSTSRVFFLVSWDPQALYTSLPSDTCLLAISWWVRDNNYRYIILDGLKLLMTHNWFEFGDSFWCQTHGAARGGPVAPPYANLF